MFSPLHGSKKLFCDHNTGMSRLYVRKSWQVCSNSSIVYYLPGDFGQALFVSCCHEDAISTRKSHSCAGTAFVQGNSTGGSKLIEQTLTVWHE